MALCVMAEAELVHAGIDAVGRPPVHNFARPPVDTFYRPPVDAVGRPGGAFVAGAAVGAAASPDVYTLCSPSIPVPVYYPAPSATLPPYYQQVMG